MLTVSDPCEVTVGNNVFVRCDGQEGQEILVIQSEATRGSDDVTRFVDGTNGGLFLYESDLFGDRRGLVARLIRLAKLVETAEFDQLYSRARAVWAAKRTPEFAAAVAAALRGSDGDGAAGARSRAAYTARAVSLALEKKLGWNIKALEARHRWSGQRRLMPVTRLTIRQWRGEDGSWTAESDELPGIRGVGKNRAAAIADAQAALFRAMAELIEQDDADEIRAVLFQVKAAKRRRQVRVAAPADADTGTTK